jgi:transposase
MGGIVTASLLSHIVVSKFADGLPFYRQEKIFARLGIWISRQNMCNSGCPATSRAESSNSTPYRRRDKLLQFFRR